MVSVTTAQLADVQFSVVVGRPPWETTPTGVVSLLAMLDFAARDFVEISYAFGLLLSDREKQMSALNQNVIGDSLTALIKHCQKLGLVVTQEHINRMLEDIVKQSPESVKFHPPEIGGFYFTDAKLNSVRTMHHIETLYSTMLAELGNLLFSAIPRDRTLYCGPKWLADTPIPNKFPTSLKELERAGNCYALGEPTACVFHSMRALEPCLNSMAAFFSLPFSHQNWQGIIEQIESKVRDLGKQLKSSQRIEDERFFGGAASQLYFVKNAWRNHVAHTRETYSDKEALSIMQHVLDFIESLCPRLSESP